MLKMWDIEEYFEVVVISADVGVEKPDPAIIELALERMNGNAGGAMYVGDSLVDFQAASAAGLFPIHIQHRQAIGRYENMEDIDQAISKGTCKRIFTLKELPDIIRSSG